nr:hypothetical protein [FCB group bacterium]
MLLRSPANPVLFDLELIVNGLLIRKKVFTHVRLLDFLRDELKLTGC